MKSDVKREKLSLLEQAVLTDSRSFAGNRAVARLVDRFSKKFEISDPSLDIKAFNGFKAINELWSDKSITPGLENNQEVLENARFFVERYLWGANKKLAKIAGIDVVPQTTLDLPLIFNFWRYGPGSSNGIKGTHFCQKIDQPFTTTERAAPFVRLLSRTIPHYNPKFGKCNVEVVDATKLTSVPKNNTVSRLIGIEPSGNMALQLSFASIVEEALSLAGFNIRIQQDSGLEHLSPVRKAVAEKSTSALRRFALGQSQVCDFPQSEWNKNMARQGSISGDFSTIDLSSASDHISVQLIKAIWPSDCFHFMDTVRATHFDCGKFDGGIVRSNIFSTMGNGFTFPVMTMTFLALYYGFLCSMKMTTRVGVDPKMFCVFGDDMVVPTHYFEGFCVLLEELGLVINKDKSFSSGFFRESCGGDFYAGKDITPFYIKSLDTEADIYTAINQVVRWSTAHFVPLTSLLVQLVKLLKDKKPLVVPFWEQDTAGIKYSQCPRRYNFLKPKDNFRFYRGDSALLVILGGYVNSVDGKLAFAPRTRKVSYAIDSARIPKGYLDGADHRYMDGDEVKWADFLIETALAASKEEPVLV